MLSFRALALSQMQMIKPMDSHEKRVLFAISLHFEHSKVAMRTDDESKH